MADNPAGRPAILNLPLQTWINQLPTRVLTLKGLPEIHSLKLNKRRVGEDHSYAAWH